MLLEKTFLDLNYKLMKFNFTHRRIHKCTPLNTLLFITFDSSSLFGHCRFWFRLNVNVVILFVGLDLLACEHERKKKNQPVIRTLVRGGKKLLARPKMLQIVLFFHERLSQEKTIAKTNRDSTNEDHEALCGIRDPFSR